MHSSIFFKGDAYALAYTTMHAHLYTHTHTILCLHTHTHTQDGIKPAWEDPKNIKGGRWLLTIDKKDKRDVLDTFWLETVSNVLQHECSVQLNISVALVCT